jgi:glycine/D-amino acid oxidase-like deaminating enzyme
MDGPGEISAPMWEVRTPRGSILTHKLVVTTNGFTSTLLSSLLMGRIVPKRSQMAAYTPPASFGGPLDFTYNIRGIYNQSTTPLLGLHHGWLQGFEEAYGLTTSDGTLIMGGELAHRASDIDNVQWVGSIDDTNVFEGTTECMCAICSNIHLTELRAPPRLPQYASRQL